MGQGDPQLCQVSKLLHKHQIGAIVQDAWPFMNPKSTRNKTEAKEVIKIDDDDDDEWGNRVDNSDDDDNKDCKLFLPFRDLTNMIF